MENTQELLHISFQRPFILLDVPDQVLRPVHTLLVRCSVTLLLCRNEEHGDEGASRITVFIYPNRAGRNTHRTHSIDNTRQRKQGTDNTLNTKLNEGNKRDTPEPND